MVWIDGSGIGYRIYEISFIFIVVKGCKNPCIDRGLLLDAESNQKELL